MTKRLMTTAIALVLIAVSCNKDCTHDYSYYIENASSGEVEVVFNHLNFVDTLSIAKGVTERLFVTNHGLENCDDGPKYQDVNEDIKSMSATLNGTPSTKDFKDNTNWTYSSGRYLLVLTSSDF